MSKDPFIERENLDCLSKESLEIIEDLKEIDRRLEFLNNIHKKHYERFGNY
jgi:hypothetical protein